MTNQQSYGPAYEQSIASGMTEEEAKFCHLPVSQFDAIFSDESRGCMSMPKAKLLPKPIANNYCIKHLPAVTCACKDCVSGN